MPTCPALAQQETFGVGGPSSQDFRERVGRESEWDRQGPARGQKGWPCRPILPSLIPGPALTLAEAQASQLGLQEAGELQDRMARVTEPLFSGAEMDH